MNTRNTISAGCLVLSMLTAMAAETTFKVTKHYLNIPVSHKCERVRFNVEIPGESPMPLDIRLASDHPDYWVFADLSAYKGKKIKVFYPDNLKGIDKIYQADTIRGGADFYKEKNRPQFHFTTRNGWINDPNGLIWNDGEYHLFYQHNPYERDWGNMHWGHAVSPDLVHWKELPVALRPDTIGTMFSGSAIIDYENTSGFGKSGTSPMVVAYTADGDKGQRQCIAYSLDNGRTFKKYYGNPVIDSGKKWNTRDTRDPKMFRYGDHWVMVLNERDGHSIYTSSNLKDWTYSSHVTGFWECPELFELPVDGNPDNTMWVMYGASGTYMLGDFDGYTFTPRSGKHVFTAGTGYAAQTFNNIPASDGRRIQIGWSRIGHPGMNFNGMMLMPVELKLQTTKEGPRLVSNPVSEIEAFCESKGKWSGLTQQEAEDILRGFSDFEDGLRVKVTFALSHATDASLSLADQRLVDYDMNGTRLNGYFYSPQDPTSMELTTDIWIDRTSAEVFVDGGVFSYSMPRDLPANPAPFSIRGNNLKIKELEIYTIPSIWEN